MCKFSTLKCGFCSSAAFIWGWLIGNVLSLQNPWKQSGMMTCIVKAKLDMMSVTKLFQSVNKHFGMQNTIEFSPKWAIVGSHFQVAASIWMQLTVKVTNFVRFLFSYFWLETGSYELIFVLSRASKQNYIEVRWPQDENKFSSGITSRTLFKSTKVRN